MEIDYALLGLIQLHPAATGYDLNRIIKESTGYFLTASLSHIYPTLKRLLDRGYVSYENIPLKNRPDKKMYQITPKGSEYLQAWLNAPVESGLDFRAFCLKMSFSPLMSKEVILRHFDRELEYRKGLHEIAPKRGILIELDYLDKEKFDTKRTGLLWDSIYQIYAQTEELRLRWLVESRDRFEKDLT
ncbi:MAG TPA: PadR family transcriptional regulator [Longilinea sp.]|nr:PadR family transcriptional regulator [Longilinea sp.]